MAQHKQAAHSAPNEFVWDRNDDDDDEYLAQQRRLPSFHHACLLLQAAAAAAAASRPPYHASALPLHYCAMIAVSPAQPHVTFCGDLYIYILVRLFT
jgi:hypothetical protein